MPDQPQFTRQTDEPLFPNTLYNRPITRHGAGRLLIVGGHSGELSQPTALYQLAVAAGVGECNVVLPDTLAKLLSGAPGTHFAASTPSGSLAPEALGRILELAEEADAVAIGASLSNNSGTAMLVEKLLHELEQPVILFGDAFVILRHNLRLIADRPRALVIAAMPEVFKLCGALDIPINIRPDAGLMNKLEIIHDLRAASACQYAVYGTEIIVAAGTEMVVTPANFHLATTPALFQATLATWWLQNRTDRRAGLTTGAFLLYQLGKKFGPTDKPTVTQLATTLDELLRQIEL
jgi:NAD(P)H-hydrate repair Nnr-like enzyme with NAD(P)H-hydrate dehydratase domain